MRVALWRGLHLEVDPPPHLVEDKIGLELADPKEGWRNRPDMKGPAVAHYRAGIVIRSRFVEDLVAEAGTSEVVLDLSDALPCDKNGLNTTQEAEPVWAPDSKRVAFNYVVPESTRTDLERPCCLNFAMTNGYSAVASRL